MFAFDGGKISERAARQRDHVGLFVEMFVVMIEISNGRENCRWSRCRSLARKRNCPGRCRRSSMCRSAEQHSMTRSGNESHVGGGCHQAPSDRFSAITVQFDTPVIRVSFAEVISTVSDELA